MRKVWRVIGERMFEGVVPIIGHAHIWRLAALATLVAISYSLTCTILLHNINTTRKGYSKSLSFMKIHYHTAHIESTEHENTLSPKCTIMKLYWLLSKPRMISVSATQSRIHPYIHSRHPRPPRPRDNDLSKPSHQHRQEQPQT